MDNIKLFKWFSVCKSTAFIVPVLPLLLADGKGLSVSDIIYISGLFSIVVISLETPLGFLADRMGSKKIIEVALIAMAFGLVLLIFLPDHWSYYGYMAGIAFSSAALSGAEDSLLWKMCYSKSKIFELKSEVSAHMYLWTILLIFSGGLLYSWQPLVPFILQIAMLLVAIYLCSKIHVEEIARPIKSMGVLRVLNEGQQEVRRPYILILIFVSSISAFTVSVANRTGPIAFSDVLEAALRDYPALISAIIFIVGNLASAQAAVVFKHLFRGQETPVIPMLTLASVSVLACIMMAAPSIVLVGLGFIILSAFKTGYRNYISALLISSLKDKRSIATSLSMLSVVSAVAAFFLSIVVSSLFSNYAEVSLFLACALLVVYLGGLLGMSYCKSEVFPVTPNNAMSGKKHYLIRNYSRWSYKQVYPAPDLINEMVISGAFRKTLYPAPALLAGNDTFLEWEYLDALPLSELSAEKQLDTIAALSKIFRDRMAQNVELSHGDLHPDNILVSDDGSITVVDWDLCGSYDLMFDPLSVFTSPKLKISNSDRLKYLCVSTGMAIEEAQEVAVTFALQKKNQLSQFTGEFMQEISRGYGVVASELSDV